MTRLRLALMLSIVTAACGGGEDGGGSGPVPTGSLTISHAGIPAGFTAPFSVLHGPQTVASGALSGPETRTFQGLPFGQYVVRWGQRVTQVAGDSFTWAAAADTVSVTATDPPVVAVGEYAAITGGIEVNATGAPIGVGVFMQVRSLATGALTYSHVDAGTPTRVTNLLPGDYALEYAGGTVQVGGLYRQAATPDTQVVTVAAGTSLTQAAVVIQPLDLLVDLTIIGLPPTVAAAFYYTRLDGVGDVSGELHTGTYRLLYQIAGQYSVSWDYARPADTTYAVSYNPGPFTLAPAWAVLRSDTIVYTPQ